MMTAKATIVLLIAYALALAAGTTSGVLAQRLWSPATVPPLAEQLRLTPSQADTMRKLWEGVSNTADDCYNQAQTIERQRDQALVDLLTDEQKVKFAAVDKGYAKQFADLTARRQAAFQDALTKTKAMLNPEQRAEYEKIIRQRLGSSAPADAAAPQMQP
jgi:Spy/CpxP family protein refolding chaperone